jgi:phage repressor protein C with HTH and peptisase S24 domain
MADSIAISAMRLQAETCDVRNGATLRFSQNGRMNIDWIRKGLMRQGKSQRGLAAALGVDPAAVNRLLKGDRQLKAAEIEKAQAYLDEAPGERDVPKFLPQTPAQAGTDRLNVLGMAECGPDGFALWNGEIVDWVARPANLAGVPKAYAVFATGSSMEPRYHPGELAFVHPGKPVGPGDYVLVQLQPPEGESTPRAVLKRLVKRTGDKVVLAQFSPEKTFTLKASEILSMHRVVGSGEA